ncbi:MAG: SPOR domain-containing protein [Cellvibrionales bacterium]|nr:MAG: SPOR domain-containing protein [Cellvibrionales bacterium]
MKLRLLVLALFLANVFYALWAQGALAAWGLQPKAVHEPQWLAQQLQPQALALRQDSKLRQQAQRLNPTQCLLSPLLDTALAQKMEALAASNLPAGSWQSLPINTPGQWMLYMGRYPNEAALAKKRQELERLRISPIEAAPTEYQPGLSLGYFDNAEQAQAALSQMQARGVRNAQIVTLKAAVQGVHIRIDQATEAIRLELAKMRPVLQAQEFAPCS